MAHGSESLAESISKMLCENNADTNQISANSESSTCTIKGDESDWRENLQGNQDLLFLHALKKSKLTDIVIEVGPESTPFEAHKLILAFGSPVFEAMFYGKLAKKGKTVHEPDIMPDVFDIFLKYLYGKAVHPESEMQACQIWKAANKYCIPTLKRKMELFLEDRPLSSSTVWQLLEYAFAFELKKLMLRCKRFLVNNAESSLRHDTFLGTSPEILSLVLQLDNVDTTELNLLNSVVRWGKYNVQSGEQLSLKNAIKPFLQYINFGALTATDFCEFLNETEGVLEDCDGLAILRHLTKPIGNPLPSWCRTTLWERAPSPFLPFKRMRSNRSLMFDEDFVQVLKVEDFSVSYL